MGHTFFDVMTPAIWLLGRGTSEMKNHQLQVAAAATGGIHYRAFHDSTLRSSLEKIGGELHAQYIISCQTNAAHITGFRRITVKISRSNVVIRNRPVTTLRHRRIRNPVNWPVLNTCICHIVASEVKKSSAAPEMAAIGAANAGYNQFCVAFSPGTATLYPMNLAAYSYWWRFTYRTNRKRGAAV